MKKIKKLNKNVILNLFQNLNINSLLLKEKAENQYEFTNIRFSDEVKIEQKITSPQPSPSREGVRVFSQSTFQKKVAFTLAEVLITLTILGVVAAIAVPSLVQRTQDRASITSVKRAYAILDNALESFFAVEGKPEMIKWPDPESSDAHLNSDFLAQELTKYIRTAHFCGTEKGCMVDTEDTRENYNNSNPAYKTLKGVPGVHSSWTEHLRDGKFILFNNMMISIDLQLPYTYNYVLKRTKESKTTTYMGRIRVDINGNKGPNRYGYDVFFFSFGKYGLQEPYEGIKKDYCSMYSTVENNSDGRDCSYWIMKHNNMDYKYRDVSKEW